ncbi:hypothetical protein LINPERHAP1_LOCUS41113, partial [Linum perenne]
MDCLSLQQNTDSFSRARTLNRKQTMSWNHTARTGGTILQKHVLASNNWLRFDT